MDEGLTMSRASLFKGVAAAGAVAAVATAIDANVENIAYADDYDLVSGALDETNEKQVGFLFQVGKCTNCNACVDACKKYNGTTDDMTPRRHLTTLIAGDGTEVYISTSCQHCENPACVEVCPAKAIEKLSNGIVALHSERCIGCKYCFEACPFSVPHYESGVMDKCDFCLGDGVEPGYRPRCASACPTGALDGGFLRDLFLRAEAHKEEDAETEGQKVVATVVDTSDIETDISRINSTTKPQLYVIDARS